MCHKADTMRSTRDRRRKRSVSGDGILRAPSALALALALSSVRSHCSLFGVATAFQPPLPPPIVVPSRSISAARRIPFHQASPAIVTHAVRTSGRINIRPPTPAHSQLHSRYANNYHKCTTALSATNNNQNNDSEKEDDTNGGPLSKITVPIRTAIAALLALLPKPVQDFLTTVSAKLESLFPTLKVAFTSFFVGTILGVGIILYPVYEAIESTPEPVMLFETILSDLDRGYVDKVDTNKLFETGMSAMLKSLDPYTEFEGKQDTADLNEQVSGQYGGVGLVISGPAAKEGTTGYLSPPDGEKDEQPPQQSGSKLLPQEAIDDNLRLNDGRSSSSSGSNADLDASQEPIVYEQYMLDSPEDDEETLAEKAELRRAEKRARLNGVRVVNAFEGYAYDYGMRVGDKITAVDGVPLTDTSTSDDVRNMLRGAPGTFVDVSFVREGVEGETTVSIPRMIVQINDVKLATLLGKPEDGIGYIQLSGFNANAGREVRNAILGLQRLTEDATGGSKTLQGLVLDLRNNPGGLLNSAVDVASLLVPQGSDIVSAKGRGFPGVLYRSLENPILGPQTKLTVLINGQTASAAEIVSGAVQDLDVGVIVGADRTFGKGLVQSVDTLPFGSALKYTVAKYYTPSGRCIQSTNYAEGEGPNSGNGGKYRASKVADKDKKTYLTKNGREVKDGGGVAVDFKVEAQKSSPLEYTLLRSGMFADFASKWSKENQLTNNLDIVTDSTYQKFKQFVMERQKEGDIQLDAVYSRPIDDLKKSLQLSGYKGTTKELEQLRASLLKDIERDFDKYKKEIKEDIGQNILARYLPESMLLEIGVKRDAQVQAAVQLMRDEKSFNTLLGRVDGAATNSAGGKTVVRDGLGTAIASSDSFIEGDTHFQIVFLGDKDIPSRTKN